MPEYIQLRAIAVAFSEGKPHHGVMLPDGRMLVWSPDGKSVTSIVSEAALAQEYPGALLLFHPGGDDAMNYTEAQ